MPLTDAQKEIAQSNARFKVVAAGRRFGKALAVDTPILTTDGWKTMLDIQVGDGVFGSRGFPIEVTGVTEVMENRDVYRVSFSDNNYIDADGEHLWYVQNRKYRRKKAAGADLSGIPTIYTTKELLDRGVLYPRTDGGVEKNFAIPTCGPLQYEDLILGLDPYSLGYWIGNGIGTTARFTIPQNDIEEVVENFAYPLWRESRFGAFTFGLMEENGCKLRGEEEARIALYELGVLNQKKIPKEYFEASIPQRLNLLQGLMDSDGHVSKLGSCEFCSANEVLAKGVVQLLQGLGIKCTFHVDLVRCGLTGKARRYRINFTTDLPVFRLHKYLGRLYRRPKKRSEIHKRYISSIDKIDSVPVKCIEVDAEDHLYLAGEALIPTHNSFLSMSLMAKAARHPKSQVWYVTTTYSAAKTIMWSILKEKLRKFRWAKSFHEVAMQAHLVNGSVISLKGTNNPDCTSDDTEILTHLGWKLFSELDKTELVATVNPETYEIEYQQPTRYIKDWYEGKMYHLESKAIDALVTPNHRFFIESRKGARRFKTLDKVSSSDGIPSPPLWKWSGENPNDVTLNDCALMGMYLADGCANGNMGGRMPGSKKGSFGVHISKTQGIKGGRKGDVFEKYKDVLDNTGMNYHTHEKGFTLYSKGLWERFFPLGNCHTKYIPEEYKNLPLEHLECLLHYMVLGDGIIGSEFGEIVYYTTSKQLADDVQEVSMKCGYSANVYEKKQATCLLKDGRVIQPSAKLWQVCLRRRKTSRFFDSDLQPYFKEVDYSGYVYCVEVPNSTIIIRRNGKACLSGNSLRGIGLDYLVIDEAAYIDERVWTEVLRPTLSDKQGAGLFISSPTGRNWFYDLWMLGQNPEEEDWESWQFTTLEGGNVPPDEIEAARRDLDARTFEQEYEAQFVTYTGLVYYGFNYQENVIDRPYDPDDPVYIGMDFNIDPMTATVFQLDDDGETLYLVDEIEIFGSNTDEMAEEILCRYPEQKIRIYPDPACVQTRTSAGGRTDLSILQSYGFQCKFRRKHPLVRDRINAVNSRLCAADGVRRLLVHRGCKRVIHALERHSYKRGTNLPEKGGEGDLSHMTDSIGYLVEYMFPVAKQEMGTSQVFGV